MKRSRVGRHCQTRHGLVIVRETVPSPVGRVPATVRKRRLAS